MITSYNALLQRDAAMNAARQWDRLGHHTQLSGRKHSAAGNSNTIEQ